MASQTLKRIQVMTGPLHLTPAGQVLLQLRRPWSDGTTHLLFDPVELLERLAVLNPRPRVNLILYHGVLGPRAAWRSLVVGFGNTADPGETSTTDAPAPPSGRRGRPPRSPAPCWADLMRRSFGIDTLACPNCAGRLRLIAPIEEPSVIERILCHLRLPTEVPTPRPGRAPPLFVARSFDEDTGGAASDPCA